MTLHGTSDTVKNPCPSCGADNRPGALVCENCGTMLAQGDGIETRALDKSATTVTEVVESTPASPEQAQQRDPFPAGTPLYLKLRGVDQPLEFNLDGGPITVGRRDTSSGHVPEVDLYDFAGYFLGVSRQHAVLQRTDELLMLQDLGSHNGTFINGKRLASYEIHPVNAGDSIQLGNLHFQVLY